MMFSRIDSKPPARSSVTATEEDAAAGRRGDLALRIVGAAHRVQKVEEEEERRDDEALRQRLAMEEGHPARQVEPDRLGVRDEGRNRSRRVADVGVCQEQIVRCSGRCQTLL